MVAGEEEERELVAEEAAVVALVAEEREVRRTHGGCRLARVRVRQRSRTS